MRIALIQMETHDWLTGTAVEKLKKYCQAAKESDCALAFAPGGFSSMNLERCLSDKDLIPDILAEALKDMLPLFIGPGKSGEAACLLKDGLVLKLSGNVEYANRLLIFSRHEEIFQSCEPVWKIFLNPVSWHPGEEEKLWSQFSQVSRANNCWVFQVNLSGGHGAEVFAGASAVFNPAGEMVALGKSFEPELLIIDTDNCAVIQPPHFSALERQWQAAVAGTRDFVRTYGNGRAVLGLSGGMDSALVACIAVEALASENVMAVLMPSRFTSRESVRDALELAENLGIAAYSIPIEPMRDAFESQLEPALSKLPLCPGHLAWENLQARIRGSILMTIANATGALTLNTGNKSEVEMGYCTLYGDMVGALSVIGDLYKTRVYELAHWYCSQRDKMLIPENILLREPTAELAPGQKDSDSLPPYPELDSVLAWLEDATLPRPQSGRIEEIRKKKCQMAYKRKFLPPVLRIGS